MTGLSVGPGVHPCLSSEFLTEVNPEALNFLQLSKHLLETICVPAHDVPTISAL